MVELGNKHKSRFRPLRILVICGVDGLSIASVSLIGCAVYGFFVNSVPDLSTIALVMGIAFVVGCVKGARKL